MSRITANATLSDVPSAIIESFSRAIRNLKEIADARGEAVAWDLLEVGVEEVENGTFIQRTVDRYLVLSAPGAKR